MSGHLPVPTALLLSAIRYEAVCVTVASLEVKEKQKDSWISQNLGLSTHNHSTGLRFAHQRTILFMIITIQTRVKTHVTLLVQVEFRPYCPVTLLAHGLVKQPVAWIVCVHLCGPAKGNRFEPGTSRPPASSPTHSTTHIKHIAG